MTDKSTIASEFILECAARFLNRRMPVNPLVIGQPVPGAITRSSALWLRGARFDLTLIVGCAVWAIVAGALVLSDSRLFLPVLMFDVWLLGYQHVVATFTRIAFDSESFHHNRLLVVALPVAVAACTVGIALAGGTWAIATIYLYWQWFHYTRQSYGISRMYLRKAQRTVSQRDMTTFGVVYAVPLLGILRRSYQQAPTFLNFDVVYLPVATPILYAVAIWAGVSVVWWVRRELELQRQGRGGGPYAWYVVSHLIVFTIAYLLIDDINVGWLVLNIWHNVQYLLIVWMSNNQRFRNGIDPEHRFLSSLSQREHMVRYFAICLALATVIFVNVEHGISLFATRAVTVSLITYMTINFHHYIVDAIIWRSRRVKARQMTLPVAV